MVGLTLVGLHHMVVQVHDAHYCAAQLTKDYADAGLEGEHVSSTSSKVPCPFLLTLITALKPDTSQRRACFSSHWYAIETPFGKVVLVDSGQCRDSKKDPVPFFSARFAAHIERFPPSNERHSHEREDRIC